MSWIEMNMERLLFASRWLMAPFYLGLAVSLAVLLLKFCQELVHFLPNLLDMKETDLILWILTLIDLSLAGNLLLIVIFSGFENFVSKMDVGEHEDKPAWMGKVDFGGLKLKLVASIVAISAIQLLKTFMNIHAADERQTFWQVVVHLTYVVSGVLLATMDWDRRQGARTARGALAAAWQFLSGTAVPRPVFQPGALRHPVTVARP
jgi:uncharacterized protein (TIGR00645 family)